MINAGNLQRFGSEQVPTAPVSQLLVGRAAFHDYIGKLRLETDFPGIQGVGFSVRVPPNQKNDFLATISRQDAKFRMWPTLKSEAGPDWHSIVYLEPRDERNEAAIGFNMYSEPTRRAAMQKARDTGDAATSGKVFLKQEITPNKQAGFIIYVPVYRGTQAPGNIKARRAQLLGFIYSPFRAGDFFQTLLDVPTQSRLLFRLYDSDALTPENLLYQSALQPEDYTPQYRSTVPFKAAGRNWTVIMENRPDFQRDSNSYLVTFVVVIGLFISAVLFGVTWTQAVAHARAEQTAWQLGQSEEKREQLLKSERHARLQAEEASRAKDDFLAVVSHELRTPLTSILGWASLIRSSQVNKDDLQRGLQTIERNAQAQAQLIEDLLDMSRIVSGRLRIETKPLDLDPILDAALDAARPAAQAKHIQLRKNYVAKGERVSRRPASFATNRVESAD